MGSRLVVAVLLLAVVGGGLWWVVDSAPGGGGDGQGAYRVVVVAPNGTILADGVVQSGSTPLAALRQLAVLENFTVDVEEQPWIGSGCTAHYVVGIAGSRESSTGGWNYYVRTAGGEWTWKPAGAGCHRLAPGEEVEWCWVELDVCRHHAP